MCRTHHRHQHAYGFKKFSEIYDAVAEALIEKGWVFEYQFGRWKLIRGE